MENSWYIGAVSKEIGFGSPVDRRTSRAPNQVSGFSLLVRSTTPSLAGRVGLSQEGAGPVPVFQPTRSASYLWKGGKQVYNLLTGVFHD